jgi:hypothetical protein
MAPTLKEKLLAKDRKTAKVTKLPMGEELVEVRIVKPTMGDKVRFLEKAQADGLVDAENNATTTLNGMRLAARMIIAVVYREGAPLFEAENIEDVVDAEWFEDLSKEVAAVFNPPKEETKKKADGGGLGSDAPAEPGEAAPQAPV